MREAKRAVICRLFILTRLITQRGAVVVERESVITVVNVDTPRNERPGGCARFPHKPGTQRLFVVAIGVVATQEIVIHKAIILIGLIAHAIPGVITDRARDHPTHTERTVVSGIQPEACRVIRGGRFGDHVDEPGQGVGPVERPLGAPQDLYLLHVEERRGSSDAAHVDAVDDETNRRIQRFRKLTALSDATNLDKPPAGRAAGKVDVWCLRQHFFQVVHDRAAIVRADDRHASGQRIDTRVAEVGSDQYLFDHVICLCHRQRG